MGFDAAAVGAEEIGGAEAAKSAGEAAAGAAAADVGTTAALAGGADAALAGGADALTAALPSTVADIGGAVGGAAGGALGGAGATSADLASAIPELTVTGAAPAAGAGLSSNLPPIAATGLAASGAGGGGSGAPGSSGVNASETAIKDASIAGGGDIAPADIGTGGFENAGGSFLPATADTSIQSLSPDVMQSLGIDPGSVDTGVGADIGGGTAPPTAPDAAGGGSWTGDIGKWLSNPKNAATAGMLGLSLKNALSQPKLPGASAAANANAAAEAKTALPIIESGGTATPAWATQKASIDATIDNQIKQQTESIMQAAASSGEGTQNSGVVQQQIAEMTRQANLQRQQLYTQAQQQNVSEALSALSGGDSTLTAIGNAQLQQSEQAQALAAQTAELALMLQSGGGFRFAGAGP